MNDQCANALKAANIARFGHRDVKQELRTGKITLATALADPRSSSLRLSVLLMSQHRFGVFAMRKALRGLYVGENRPVGTLTDRERGLISEACR